MFTAHCEGANSAGTVYKLTPSGGTWTYISLTSLPAAATAYTPSINGIRQTRQSLRNDELRRREWVWSRLQDQTVTEPLRTMKRRHPRFGVSAFLFCQAKTPAGAAVPPRTGNLTSDTRVSGWELAAPEAESQVFFQEPRGTLRCKI